MGNGASSFNSSVVFKGEKITLIDFLAAAHSVQSDSDDSSLWVGSEEDLFWRDGMFF